MATSAAGTLGLRVCDHHLHHDRNGCRSVPSLSANPGFPWHLESSSVVADRRRSTTPRRVRSRRAVIPPLPRIARRRGAISSQRVGLRDPPRRRSVGHDSARGHRWRMDSRRVWSANRRVHTQPEVPPRLIPVQICRSALGNVRWWRRRETLSNRRSATLSLHGIVAQHAITEAWAPPRRDRGGWGAEPTATTPGCVQLAVIAQCKHAERSGP